MPKFKPVSEAEWVRPIKRGYKMACCDCGLVHKLNFKHIKWGRGRKILFQAFRDDRATASLRLRMKRDASTNTDRAPQGLPYIPNNRDTTDGTQ